MRIRQPFGSWRVDPYPSFICSLLPSFFLPFFLYSDPPGGRFASTLTPSWPPARCIISQSDLLEAYFFRCQFSYQFFMTFSLLCDPPKI